MDLPGTKIELDGTADPVRGLTDNPIARKCRNVFSCCRQVPSVIKILDS